MSSQVLYLVAKGRSGSNIMAHALGQMDGFVNTGELYHLWRWGLEDRAFCGCGDPVPTCQFWCDVLEAAKFEHPTRRIADLQDEVLSWAAIPRLVGSRASGSQRTLQDYVRVRRKLYRAILAISGADVVVDASKWPWDPAVLGMLDLDVRPLLLVRDPRAVAFSWQRDRHWGDHAANPTPMPRFSAASSTLSWTVRNLLSEAVRRAFSPADWMTVRYEDFVAAPANVLKDIARHAGRRASPPMAGARAMRMAPTHSLGGNASRFSGGTVQLRRDDEWRDVMDRSDVLTSTAIALPLLATYRYPLVVRRT